MIEETAFFISREGAVWACWLDGRRAVKLGLHQAVYLAMAEFLGESEIPAPEPLDAGIQSTPLRGEVCINPPPSGNEVKIASPEREGNERAADRHDLTIIGKVFTTGGSWEVTILDLSEKGCRFRNRDTRLMPEAPFTIKLGPIGPIEATLRWRSGGEVGAEFKNALYPSVLEHITKHFDLRK
jgi:hypothetical protein